MLRPSPSAILASVPLCQVPSRDLVTASYGRVSIVSTAGQAPSRALVPCWPPVELLHCHHTTIASPLVAGCRVFIVSTLPVWRWCALEVTAPGKLLSDAFIAVALRCSVCVRSRKPVHHPLQVIPCHNEPLPLHMEALLVTKVHVTEQNCTPECNAVLVDDNARLHVCHHNIDQHVMQKDAVL